MGDDERRVEAGRPGTVSLGGNVGTRPAPVTRRLWLYSSLTVLAIALILLILVSPIVLFWIAAGGIAGPFKEIDWQLVGNVGQAYGGVSAILAGLAFLAVAVSLLMQARQARVAQLQAAHAMQLELFRLAYEHPDLQEGWSRSVDLPYPEWRLRTYVNLVFAYLRMSYEMQTLSEPALRRALRNRFQTSLGRAYWEGARNAWRTGARGHRQRNFYQLSEEAFLETAVNEQALPKRQVQAAARSENATIPNEVAPTSPGAHEYQEIRTGVALAVGAIGGLAVGILINRPKRGHRKRR